MDKQKETEGIPNYQSVKVGVEGNVVWMGVKHVVMIDLYSAKEQRKINLSYRYWESNPYH